MRIVLLTRDSLVPDVIVEAVLRELPGMVVGIVASTAAIRGVSRRRAVWRRLRQMFVVAAVRALEVQWHWWLRRRQRSSKLPPRLRTLAASCAVPLIGTRDINSAGTLAALQAMKPDLLIGIYFNQRLKREAFAVARYGAINMHPAPLPKHRGPSPSFWVVASGDERSAITVHWIDEAIDTGEILLQRELAIPAGTSVTGLMGMVARPGAQALIDAVRLIEAGTAPRRAQAREGATYDLKPTQRDLARLWRRGGRYGTGLELVRACERKE